MGKFYTRPELVAARAEWKRDGKIVVFTNGCYDLLHPGHIRLLEQARSLGDILILALNTDASVRRFKGPSRPVIADILPDILVKGADWSHFIAGREEVEAAGGKVIALPLEPGWSTTNLVDRI